MNPFKKLITFVEEEPKFFYCVKDNNNRYVKVNPKKGDLVFRVPWISGGEEKKIILLEIPIPLCKKHQHNGVPFGVKTCTDWEYIAIPVQLGSMQCLECIDKMYLPTPFLCSVDLSDANLSDANLSDANLSGANLSDADLRNTKNINFCININTVYWNKFTKINKEFKTLLNREKFLND